MVDAARTRTHSPRARPVAQLPGETLIARADELARRWAIALILARPTDAIGDVPLEELAREAPALCAQVLSALQSDVELERLTGRGAPTGREASAAARRLSAICGAREPAALVDAVEALRGVLWEALLDELSEPPVRLVGDLSDRLAHVCSAMLAVAVDATGTPPLDPTDERVELERQAPSAREPSQSTTVSGAAVIVDEHAGAGAWQSPRERRQLWPQPTPAPGSPRFVRERSWTTPGPVTPGVRGEIEIRDERREEGAAAWIGSITAQLERFERDGLPFAVLLVELVDIERLRREEPPEELSQLTAGVEEALSSALGEWAGALTRERPGRFWLLAPATDRSAAARLAERLTRAVGARAGHRGAPLVVAIGVAVCPEDGRQAAALAAHADVGLFAARSAVNVPAPRVASVVDESA
jgi:GGDEF domain-containing protein